MATAETDAQRWRSVVRTYPAPAFFLLTFTLTWPGGILAALASRDVLSEEQPALAMLGVLETLGPALAAIIVAGSVRGRPGIDDLFRSIVRGGRRLGWYVLVVLGQLVISGTALLLTAMTGQTDAGVEVAWAAIPVQLLGIAAALTVWEEMGFRGVGQRVSQRRLHPLVATLLVGVLWAVWHLPLMFTVNSPTAETPPVLFVLDVLAAAILYAWLFNRTAHSLLFVTLFHALGNVFGLIVLDNDMGLGRYLAFRLPIVWVAAVVLVVITGGRLAADRAELAIEEPTGR